MSGETSGAALAAQGVELRGYEIHMGRTSLASGVRPFAFLRAAGSSDVAHADGAVSARGRSAEPTFTACSTRRPFEPVF